MTATNLPKLKYVSVNAIDISSYVGAFTVSEKFGKYFKTAVIKLKKTVSDVLTYNDKELMGSAVLVKRGVSAVDEDILFRGTVAGVDFKGGIVTINCEDKLSDTKYITVNESFDWSTDTEAGVGSEIVKTLLSENTSLTYSASSIQSTGSVNIIKKLVLRHRSVWSALKEIAYAMNFRIYYNPNDDLVYFEPSGFSTGTTILSTTTNIVKLPKWVIDPTKLFNKITVIGSPQEVIKRAGPYLLDGSQTGWTTTSITLGEKPIAVKVLSDTSNPPTTQKILGVEGTSTTYDYEVNKEAYKITWNSTFTPTTSYYAQVEYTYNEPVNISRKNQSSIDLYTGGVAKEVVQNREDIKTNDDASLWGQKQLAIYSEPFYSTTLSVRSVTDLMIGHLYTVQDNIQDVEEELMITEIKYTYPYRYDEIKVSDKEYRENNLADSPSERLKRLEEKQTDDSEKLVIYNDFTRDIKVEKRETKVQQRGITGTFMIYGHPSSRGVWGTPNTWGVNGNSYSTKKLTPGDNVFKEFGYDNDYFSSSSTATQDLTDNEVDFTSGQVYQTELISLGTTHTYFTIALASTTGTFTTTISGDGGSTYQAVTLNSRTAFTSADANGVIIKVTESGSTTGTLKNTYNTDDSYNEPILKCTLEN